MASFLERRRGRSRSRGRRPRPLPHPPAESVLAYELVRRISWGREREREGTDGGQSVVGNARRPLGVLRFATVNGRVRGRTGVSVKGFATSCKHFCSAPHSAINPHQDKELPKDGALFRLLTVHSLSLFSSVSYWIRYLLTTNHASGNRSGG